MGNCNKTGERRFSYGRVKTETDFDFNANQGSGETQWFHRLLHIISGVCQSHHRKELRAIRF